MTDITVKTIMVSDLITADANDSLFAVYQILKKFRIHHIPVIDKSGDIKGIISWTDIERLKVGASLFKNPKKEEYTEAYFHSMRACDIMGGRSVFVANANKASSARVSWGLSSRRYFTVTLPAATSSSPSTNAQRAPLLSAFLN